ncbi:MAG: helix-turn-helix transcriptional regulator [Elusimicrobia bacterium]|nr:helix-turn-helix transcriptional regulator [Elusimicrobiota bacterium]
MREAKRQRLEAKGWKVGNAKDFLALSDQEAEYIELKLKLAEGLRSKRRQRRLGQTDLAKLVRSSQSRVAKMEAADNSVSIDLLIRSLLALGISNPELGRMIARSHVPPPPR